MTFLGIRIDSISQTVSLPPKKLVEIMALINEWSSKSRCTRTELQSLIGSLQFAAKCIPPGRLFTRRLINLLCLSRDTKFIALDEEIRLDIVWWKQFLPLWNGTASFLSINWLSPFITHLFTDSASSVVFAGFCDGQWFNARWSEFAPDVKNVCIELLEMIPIYAACALWGHKLHCKKILFHSDNLGCVQAWANLGSSNAGVLSLMRAMVALAAQFNFAMNIVHVGGVNN